MTRGYLRFPHLAGDLLTFVAEDDIWLAPLDGGRAWRITTDHVPVSRPRLSPDGQRVAWTSTIDGAPEVHVVDLDGGQPARLTHFGMATTMTFGWMADGRLLAGSHAGEESRSRRVAYAIELDGGAPERLPYGYVSNVALAPTGAVLTATAGTVEVAWWKGYRGGTATKLWLDRRGDGDFQRLFADEVAPLESPVWLDDGATIGLVSDREGSSDLWIAALPADALPTTADLRRVTDTEFYVRHATSDGRRVVFQSGGEIWRWDGGEAAPIEIELAGERRATRPTPIDAGHHLGAIAPAVDGRGSAVEVRGTVSWVTHRDGPVRALASGSAVRRRLPVVVSSGGDVAWVTDADGDDAVELWDAAADQTRTFAGGAVGRVLELVAAPDGSLLAGASHDGRLLGADGRLGRAARSRSHRQWRHHRGDVLARLSLAGLVAPRSVSVGPYPAHRGRRPCGGADRRHAVALRRHRAGLQHRRQVPGVPLDAQLRPDLRRLRVRPVVSQRDAAPARRPRGDDPVTVRS